MKLLLLPEHVELLVEMVVDVGLSFGKVLEHGQEVGLGLFFGEVTVWPVESLYLILCFLGFEF